MNITELFKDVFNYSTRDWGKVLILGALIFGILILALITGISAIFGQIAVVAIIGIITGLFAIIVGLIYNGYGLTVIRDTIINRNISIAGKEPTLPEFKWSENIIDGLKVLILTILYMIIPAIVGIILAYGLGVFSDVVVINQTMNIYNQTGAHLPYTFSTISMGGSAGFSIAIVHTVTVLLAIIFTLFATIAMARLAETGRLGSIIEFNEIINTISKIGWGNYIIWFILLYIIVTLISLIAALIIFIPILGIIIYLFIIPAFLIIFKSRAIGLIYNASKE